MVHERERREARVSKDADAVELDVDRKSGV